MSELTTYIAETGRSVSDSIERDLAQGFEIDAIRLARDVGWMARHLAKLAESVGERERDALSDLSYDRETIGG